MTAEYDLAVIGGGAAGLVAAREARRRGASTVIVQDGPVGGECTFTGCVPSKTLLAAAASRLGFQEAMNRVRRTVERIAASEDDVALAGEGIDVIHGRARFRSPTTIEVDGRQVRSSRFVVATGSRPAVPEITGMDGLPLLTNETVFELRLRPESMIVLGGGPIGCELAQAFARLGTRVTLVESGERILSGEEIEASRTIAGSLTDDGVAIHSGSTVERAARNSEGAVCLHLDDDATVNADQVLAAVGRVPSGRGFGLEEIGVDVDERGAIAVDPTMATSVPGIWAAGDVTGGLQFTHAAGRMGWVAASNALAKRARVRRYRFDPAAVPWATFTNPEVGRVGLTEPEAADAHDGARVAHLALSYVDRAIAAGTERGFVKLIAAPRPLVGNVGGGRLVGATIVAPGGGDLIHEAALAMHTGMFVGRLAQASHAYPTWAMATQQAALQFFGRSGGLHARPARREPAV